MSLRNVKQNVQTARELQGWEGALADAERKLREAEQDALEWKAAVLVCRKKVATRAPWPGKAISNG
jgi:hypothetical protein